MKTSTKTLFKKRLRNYVRITAASFVYGLAMALFLDPLDLAPGGFSGIAIILNRFLEFGVGTWFMILNIPVLLLGIWKFGIRFTVSTIYSTALTSLFTNLIAEYFGVYAVQDIILGVVFGSIMIAFAIGITFLSGATTGGSDIIVKLLRLRYPYLKTGRIFFLMDLVVVIAAGITFRNMNAALYSLISVFLMSYVLDLVLYGRDGAKLIYIISERSGEISARLLKELDVGATYITGRGAYSGKKKQVIMCVIRKVVYPKAEEVVREEDPEAFLIVSNASEIFGEGYKSYFDERV
ncbi:MAG: YitT family protein [Lachnospiraceae bacterium]|nr:YitT family protein [Lachnospiraceae bacterium]